MRTRNFAISRPGKIAMLLTTNFVRWKLMNSMDALPLLRPRSSGSRVCLSVLRSERFSGNPLRAFRMLGVLR